MLIHISVLRNLFCWPGQDPIFAPCLSQFWSGTVFSLNLYGFLVLTSKVSISYPSCFLWQENDQAGNSYASWLTELKPCDDIWLNLCCRVSSLNLSNRSGSVFASIWYFFFSRSKIIKVHRGIPVSSSRRRTPMSQPYGFLHVVSGDCTWLNYMTFLRQQVQAIHGDCLILEYDIPPPPMKTQANTSGVWFSLAKPLRWLMIAFLSVHAYRWRTWKVLWSLSCCC